MDYLLIGMSLLLILGAFLWAYRLVQQGQASQRLATDQGEISLTVAGDREEFESNPLRYWLFKAGYRQRNAPAVFVGATALCLVLGLGAGWMAHQSGFIEIGAAWLNEMPGNYGDLFHPILWVAPVIVFLVLVSLPLLQVRARRRERVASVERDLPIVMELLATLGEAGMAFDGSVARILDSEKRGRPLFEELQNYRKETLSGIPKIRCLRRLDRRVDVGAMTNVVSSLVQAEQVGSSTAAVLRRQANDLRLVHREKAMVLAQALPVKLVFPLVICFLPGIFVGTLFPIFNEFINTVESTLR